MDLSTLQEELHEWRMRNFPDCTASQQFMGMVEEMGEIAHAILKHEQGIRTMDNFNQTSIAIKDGVADLTIFMMGLCSLMNWDLCTLVYAVAHNEVMKRDWIMYPGDGLTK